MSVYRVLQLTNNNVSATAIDALLPLGTITRKICCSNSNCTTPTFAVSTTGTDTITINEPGNYNIIYSGSLVAGAIGTVTVSLLVNGNVVYSANETATAAGDTINLTAPYQIRVLPNCCANQTNNPANIQVQLTGTAITGGTSNIIIERVY